MATLIARKNKAGKIHYTVQVTLAAARPCIALGPVGKAAAQEAKGCIESLAASRRTGTAIAPRTAAWLADLTEDFYALLAERGLCDPKVAEVACQNSDKQITLGPFVDGYIDGRSDVKESTATVYGHTRRCLKEFFGADKAMAEITAAEAGDFRRWLSRPKSEGGQGLAENTVRRRCAIAKQFLDDAVERELIQASPFRKMKGLGVKPNRSRDYFVTREEADAVLASCPDNQWKLLFALSRYGALRCPSEHLALTWADVDWNLGTLRIRASKTEHHEGHEERTNPIWNELLPYLQAAWDDAAVGSEFVITRYRDTNANLRTQLNRIIRKAGLKSWPKLFQNLRATRATELLEATHDAQQVAEWTGHSVEVLLKHYSQMTRDRRARSIAAVVANSCAAIAQQQPTETTELDGNERTQESEKALDVRITRVLPLDLVGGEGLEP